MEAILCMLSWAWLALETSVLLSLSISVVCWIIKTCFTKREKKSYQQLLLMIFLTYASTFLWRFLSLWDHMVLQHEVWVYSLSTVCKLQQKINFFQIPVENSTETSGWGTLVLTWYYLITLIFFFFSPQSRSVTSVP